MPTSVITSLRIPHLHHRDLHDALGRLPILLPRWDRAMECTAFCLKETLKVKKIDTRQPSPRQAKEGKAQWSLLEGSTHSLTDDDLNRENLCSFEGFAVKLKWTCGDRHIDKPVTLS